MKEPKPIFHPDLATAMPESRIADYTRSTSVAEARQGIQAAYPDLKIESIEFMAKGMGNDVFRVNGNDLFRFAKAAEGSKSMAKEARLLPALEGHLSVPIPHYQWAKLLENGNARFVGYAMLPGVHPEKEHAYGPDGAPNAELARQLGQFFTQLHGFDAEKARALNVDETDYRSYYTRQLNDYRKIVFPLLRQKFPADADALIEKLEAAYAWYFSDPANLTFDRKLIHGDFETENMLIDPKDGTMSAVIDWSGANLGDPDADLWRFYSTFGKKFMDEVLKTYQHPDHERLYRKLDFFTAAQFCYRFMRAALKEGVESDRAKRRYQDLRERLLGGQAG